MNRTIRTSELEDIVVAGINPRDHPDFSDAYIEEACWKDTGEPLTDEELELIDASDAFRRGVGYLGCLSDVAFTAFATLIRQRVCSG